MAKEKKTDILVARLLTEAGIDFTPEESSIAEINEALKRLRSATQVAKASQSSWRSRATSSSL